MSKTIVLIDDDQDDLDLLREAIQKKDSSLHCISFIYPTEAIRVISKELIVIPQYVFLDINMPRMSGDQCVIELRRLKEFESTIIVVLSTGMTDLIGNVLKERGANYAFKKPEYFQGYSSILQEVFKTET